jgi:hypothetical protein
MLNQRKALEFAPQPAYNGTMSEPNAKPGVAAKAALLGAVLIAVIGSMTNAQAQTHRHRERGSPTESDRPAPAVPIDKRDSVVAAPGPYTGRPYWLALAQCGGIYFKLNVLYADVAVHARVIKPDPTLNNEATKKLNDAIKTATIFYTAAERFLMNDRGIERIDAVLVYSEQARAAGDRIKGSDTAASVLAGQSAAKACPVLYQACQAAFPKACSDQISPVS